MFDNLTKTNAAAPNPKSVGDVVADVTRHWSSLRAANQAPNRNQIDASAIAHALPHVFLAELVTPRVAKLRICGQHVEDLLGMDMRGMPLTALFQGKAREEIAEALEQVARGARVTLSLEGETGFGMPKLTAVLALLPLTDAAGQITRVLGVLEYAGEKGRTPRRFTLAQPLEAAAPITPEKRAPRPFLRVLQGGKS